MTVDPADSSYMPSLVVVSGGLKCSIFVLALTTDLAQMIDVDASPFLRRWKLFEQLD